MKMLGLTNVDIGSSQATADGVATLISLTNSEVEELENSGAALSIDLMSTVNRKGRMDIFPNTYSIQQRLHQRQQSPPLPRSPRVAFELQEDARARA